jgi:hypothetical protein
MVKELAYLVICHQSAAHVADLLASMYTPDDIFLIHCDRKAPTQLQALVDTLVATFHNVHRLEGTLVSWGGFSQAEIVLRAAHVALGLSNRWSHLIPLSEQHIPLCPPAQIREEFAEGESLIDARRFSDMSEAEQTDILHRFGMLYRELPGVGPFALANIERDDIFMDRLRHASNWFVLARDACSVLATLTAATPAVTPFTRCIQPDEMLVPTVLLGTKLGQGLRITARNPSFIAHPHLSGTPDLTFTVANFHSAREAGYLFIRKRPDKLPRVILDHLRFFNLAMVRAVLPIMRSVIPDQSAERPEVEAALAGLVTGLMAVHGDLNVTRLTRHEAAYAPQIHLTFIRPAWPDGLSVVLLSEDTETFKAVLLWRGADRAGLAPVVIGRFKAVVCKARVHGVAFAREVVAAGEPHGFVIIPCSEQARPLLWRRLETVLLRQLALANLFAGEVC